MEFSIPHFFFHWTWLFWFICVFFLTKRRIALTGAAAVLPYLIFAYLKINNYSTVGCVAVEIFVYQANKISWTFFHGCAHTFISCSFACPFILKRVNILCISYSIRAERICNSHVFFKANAKCSLNTRERYTEISNAEEYELG